MHRFSPSSTLMKRLRRAVPLATLAMTAVLALGGCDRGKAGDKGADATAAKATTEAKKDGEAKPAAASGGDCAGYAEALCGEFGATSPNCAAAKNLVDYMPAKACAAGLADMAHTKSKLANARKSCDELVDKLCKDLEKGSSSCDMVKERKSSLQPEKCKEMLANYSKVLDELNKRDAQNRPLDAATQAKIAADDAAAKGPSGAKVTIVEFSDFECPYCSRAANATNEIIKNYGDKVRVVFRHFPLSFHKNAHLAAQASLAANAQGKFWAFHDKMFENQRALTRGDLEKYAKEIGLNMKKFKTALDKGTFKDQVDKDMKLGSEVAVSGTPTMFLNGKRVANATSFPAIKKEIDAALEG